MFSFPLCSIARSTWAFRLRGFIARRACIVSVSLMFTMTSRCVCTMGALRLCVLYVPASGAPLATAAALTLARSSLVVVPYS
jgi:hypothetical protein